MLRISKALHKIIKENNFLQFGIAHQLFNLSQLSEFLRPNLEVLTKKSLKKSAVLMNLSRLQRNYQKTSSLKRHFEISNISILSNLYICTFPKSSLLHKQVNCLYNQIQKLKKYISITEGVSEITLIIHQDCKRLLLRYLNFPKKHSHSDISGIGVKFDEKYIHIPGLLYRIIQQITLQNINIIELSSTFTEFILYIDTKDTTLAFETIFQNFNHQD